MKSCYRAKLQHGLARAGDFGKCAGLRYISMWSAAAMHSNFAQH